MATPTAPSAPGLAAIEAARERIRGVAHVTPVQHSETFSRRAGREVLLKAENLQRTGSFKVRGAVNAIGTLGPAQHSAGVAAATAGNHGQAVAWAAREAGVAATVFMPHDAPMAKVEATKTYGAAVRFVDGLEAAFEAARAYADESGAAFLHAFEDERVIAGQGTIGLELAEQLPEDATVVVPVGGGGLASGIALALAEKRPRMRVVGVQASRCAPLAGRAYEGVTIADGIAVKHPGELTAAVLRDRLDGIVTVDDDEISEAIVLLAERAKLVVEGAGAVGLAALLAGRVGGTGPVGIVVSGGNIDPTLLLSVMRQGLTRAGRYLVVRTRVPDRPGELVRLLSLIAKERVNVVEVSHRREGTALTIGETEVELTLATRDAEHCTTMLETMRRWGYDVERMR